MIFLRSKHYLPIVIGAIIGFALAVTMLTLMLTKMSGTQQQNLRPSSSGSVPSGDVPLSERKQVNSDNMEMSDDALFSNSATNQTETTESESQTTDSSSSTEDAGTTQEPTSAESTHSTQESSSSTEEPEITPESTSSEFTDSTQDSSSSTEDPRITPESTSSEFTDSTQHPSTSTAETASSSISSSSSSSSSSSISSSSVTAQSTVSPTAPANTMADWLPAVIGMSVLAAIAVGIVITILVFKYVCLKTPNNTGSSAMILPNHPDNGLVNDGFGRTDDMEANWPVVDGDAGNKYSYGSTDL